jgi:hypothetical protein
MGREIGARTLVSESGSLWTCPLRPDVGPDLRGSPHGGCLKPWSRPGPAASGYRPRHQVCSLSRAAGGAGARSGAETGASGPGAGAGAARGERSEPP